MILSELLVYRHSHFALLLLLLLLRNINIVKELRVELFYRLFVELYFTQRTCSLVLTPCQDAITVEKVAYITGKSYDFVAFLKGIHADSTFYLTLEEIRIVKALVQRK